MSTLKDQEITDLAESLLQRYMEATKTSPRKPFWIWRQIAIAAETFFLEKEAREDHEHKT